MNILDKIASWLERREICNLRKEIDSLLIQIKELETTIKYLRYRDNLCNSMANTINKQMFQIEELKGVYSKSKKDI